MVSVAPVWVETWACARPFVVSESALTAEFGTAATTWNLVRISQCLCGGGGEGCRYWAWFLIPEVAVALGAAKHRSGGGSGDGYSWERNPFIRGEVTMSWQLVATATGYVQSRVGPQSNSSGTLNQAAGNLLLSETALVSHGPNFKGWKLPNKWIIELYVSHPRGCFSLIRSRGRAPPVICPPQAWIVHLFWLLHQFGFIHISPRVGCCTDICLVLLIAV